MMRAHIGGSLAVRHKPAAQCQQQTQELTVDCRKKVAKTHPSVYITGAEMERVNNFMFLRITTHICPEKKIKLCHLRKIKKIPSKVLVNIYREAMVCELVCARPRSGRQN